MIKFNVLTCDTGKRKDGTSFFKIIGTLSGECILNNKQVVTFYSNTSAIAGQDYEVILYSTDMQNIKLRLSNEIFKK